MSREVPLEEVRPAWRLVLGLLMAALGVAFFLMAVRAIPIPDESLHAPRWVLALIGVLTGFVGGSMAYSGARGLLRPELEGTRPALPPVLSWLLGATVVTGLGVVATWAGLGPGERDFQGGFTGSEMEGRIVFGTLGILFDVAGIWLFAWGIRRLRRGQDP